jgi:activator of the mannose operon, transcriptional antiterminator
MNMNSRQKELLRLLLLHKEDDLQIKDLAAELCCAEKTVRNDLDRLEEFLRDYESAHLYRKPGIGIGIEIDEHDRSEIMRSLLVNESKTLEERLFEMAFQLLTSHKPFTLQYWADRYYVPKPTIKRDIETITNWLQRYGLELISKQRLGNMVQGSELKKRNALAHLPELIPAFSNTNNVVLDLFLPYEIAAVRKALIDMQHTFSVTFTDEAVESLLVHALIMVKRIRQKSPVFIEQNEKTVTHTHKEYQYTAWLFKQLEAAYQLKFPEEEKVYFTWHLISAKRMAEGSDQEELQYNEETSQIVHALIERMGKLTLFPFEQDLILQNGLAVHMHSVISRIRYQFPITNPLLANIKHMYPYMFSMVILSLEEISKTFDIEIPEDEAAYILLHFQASIERLEGKREAEKKKTLIVCHMGIGMSHLLEAKIEQQYQDIEVVACVGKAEVNEFLRQNSVDFIITTVPLEKVGTDTIVISPLFGQEDKRKLSQFVAKIQVDESTSPFLPYLNEELVFFKLSKEHRYEVVEMLAMALYKEGYVKREFIYSSVKREQKSATAVGGGIAIPHGDPAYILKPVIAAAVLREPLIWGEEKVSLVFLLALTKENQAELREIIGKIASLSDSPLVVHELTETENFHSFVKVLEEN